MQVFVPTKDGVQTLEFEPDVFVVLEVGRALTLPDYMMQKEVRRVSAIKALSPNEIPEVAKRLYDLVSKIPLDKKVALVVSGPLALTGLFFAFQGIHRTLCLGQFNPSKGDYDWFLIEPSSVRNFFLV
jgi:hypothetical protein